MTLKNIADDIILTATNGILSSSRKLSFNQVVSWINSYRALLIKRDIDKMKEGEDVPDRYTQMVYGVKLQQVPNSEFDGGKSSSLLMESEEKLPTLMVLHNRPAMIAVYDSFGNPIQSGSKSKSKFQQYRQYTCADYIAYIQSGKLRIEGPNLIERVDVSLIADNPADIDSCGYENGNYPIPEDKIPILKNMIFTQELGMRQATPSDTTNNSQDDTVNNVHTLNARTVSAVNRNLGRMDYE